jgi:hypothetical protein
VKFLIINIVGEGGMWVGEFVSLGIDCGRGKGGVRKKMFSWDKVGTDCGRGKGGARKKMFSWDKVGLGRRWG